MTFSQKLIQWYLSNKRSLPWRETKNPYYIWLSEIILQQTQIKQGLPYYLSFIKKFPTVFDLAKADEKEILNLWQGLGYYSRARNLHFTAKKIVSEFDGVFPNKYKDLIKLKGVGDYTASAIASICFNEPTPVLDGNVFRVLSRFYGIKIPINSSQGKKKFKVMAQQLIDSDDPATFNQAIMEFGAIQCKPQNPDCSKCIFNEGCIALDKALIKDLPVKLKKQIVTKRYFNFLVFISDDSKTIIEQRNGKGIWQNLYQFPLIETPKKANEKMILESSDLNQFTNGQEYSITVYNDLEIIHRLSHQHLYTTYWIIRLYELPKNGIPINTLREYPVPILIDNFINEFNF